VVWGAVLWGPVIRCAGTTRDPRGSGRAVEWTPGVEFRLGGGRRGTLRRGIARQIRSPLRRSVFAPRGLLGPALIGARLGLVLSLTRSRDSASRGTLRTIAPVRGHCLAPWPGLVRLRRPSGLLSRCAGGAVLGALCWRVVLGVDSGNLSNRRPRHTGRSHDATACTAVVSLLRCGRGVPARS